MMLVSFILVLLALFRLEAVFNGCQMGLYFLELTHNPCPNWNFEQKGPLRKQPNSKSQLTLESPKLPSLRQSSQGFTPSFTRERRKCTHIALTCRAVVTFRSNAVTLSVSHLLVATLHCIIWPLQHPQGSTAKLWACLRLRAEHCWPQTHNTHRQVVFYTAEPRVGSLLCVDGTTLALRIKSELCPCQCWGSMCFCFHFPLKLWAQTQFLLSTHSSLGDVHSQG